MRVWIDTLMSAEYSGRPVPRHWPLHIRPHNASWSVWHPRLQPDTNGRVRPLRRPQGGWTRHRAICRTHLRILSNAVFPEGWFRRRLRVRNLARHHLCRWRTTLGHRSANLSRHLGLTVHPAYIQQRRGWSRLVKLRPMSRTGSTV